MPNFLLLLVISFTVRFSSCEEAGVNKPNYKDVVFTYPTGVRSERDIPVCPSSSIPALTTQFPKTNVGASLHESAEDHTEEEIKLRAEGETACNIIHKRYFFSPIVERLCRCPDRSECSWHWSQGPSYPNLSSKQAQQNKQEKQQQTSSTSKPENIVPTEKVENSSSGGGGSGGTAGVGSGGGKRDPHTIMINNRSQLKFCNEVTSLARCKGKKPSLYRVIKGSSSGGSPSEGQITLTNVTCYCPPLYRHWVFAEEDKREFTNGTIVTTLMYRCDKLPKCGSMEKCGNIRTDYHSTFYHCSCPLNHLCLPKDEEEVEVDEIFYKGPALQAFCTPF